MACLAKQERLRISERTRAGLARIRAKGTALGRPKTGTAIIQKAKLLKEHGLSFAEIGKELNLSKARAYHSVN